MLTIVLQHFYLNDLLDYLKIFQQDFLIIFNLLSHLDTIRALVLKTAVYIIIFINKKIYDVFYSKYVQAILNLLRIDSLYKFYIILQVTQL